MELTMKEERRLEVIQKLLDDQFSVQDAGKVLNRSERQIYRILKRIRMEGVKGVIHKNTGRKSPKKICEKTRQKIIGLVSKKYSDINDTHLNEILQRENGIVIGRETLRKILREAGFKPKKKRRKKKYHMRRDRKAAFGMMIQMDASDHDWLEGRGPKFSLVLAIDDATNYIWAYFVNSESTWAYLDLMYDICISKGVPLSIYNDRHTIFTSQKKQTVEQALENKRSLTQFGRAIDELGIQMILAYSPQAKGRVERQFDTLQDRLVVELRLAKVKTKAEANQVLKKIVMDFNKRFTVKPRDKESVFQKRPHADLLKRILCIKNKRTVRNDNTVSFKGLTLQIPKTSKYRSFAKRKVDILQLRDSSIEIEFKKDKLVHFNPEEVAFMIKKKTFKCLDDDLKLAEGF